MKRLALGILLVLASVLAVLLFSERSTTTTTVGEPENSHGPAIVARSDNPPLNEQPVLGRKLRVEVLVTNVGPLANARVELPGGVGGVTNANGLCDFDGLTLSQASVSVSHPEWGRKAVDVDLAETQELAVTLEPKSTIEVTVTATPATGPIDLVVIEKASDDTPALMRSKPFRTFEPGPLKVRFDQLPPGVYFARAASIGTNAVGQAQARLRRNGDVTEVELALSEAASDATETVLRGTVRLGGVEVQGEQFVLTVMWPHGMQHVQSVVTDEQGNYRITVPWLLNGARFVASHESAVSPFIKEHRSSSLDEAILDIDFREGLDGGAYLQISSIAGVPIVNTNVVLSSAELEVTLSTDEQGRMPLHGLPLGVYSATCKIRTWNGPLDTMLDSKLHKAFDMGTVEVSTQATSDEVLVDVPLLLVDCGDTLEFPRFEWCQLVIDQKYRQRRSTRSIVVERLPTVLTPPDSTQEWSFSGEFELESSEGREGRRGVFLKTPAMSTIDVNVQLDAELAHSTKPIHCLDQTGQFVEDCHIVTDLKYVGVRHDQLDDEVIVRRNALIHRGGGKYDLNSFASLPTRVLVVSRTAGWAALDYSAVTVGATVSLSQAECLTIESPVRVRSSFDLFYESGRAVRCRYLRGAQPKRVFVPLAAGELPAVLVINGEAGGETHKITGTVQRLSN